VVLNQNLFEVPEEAIGDTEVLMTLFEGRVVYE
jgi:predicted amidohydrolase YtcJ